MSTKNPNRKQSINGSLPLSSLMELLRFQKGKGNTPFVFHWSLMTSISRKEVNNPNVMLDLRVSAGFSMKSSRCYSFTPLQYTKHKTILSWLDLAAIYLILTCSWVIKLVLAQRLMDHSSVYLQGATRSQSKKCSLFIWAPKNLQSSKDCRYKFLKLA